MAGTLLTGEPLSWQLTNEQREYLGLAPVGETWTLQEVPCGILADCETYIYLYEGRIMRVISCGENVYEEGCFDVQLTEDGRIAPVKPGGKSIPLTAANLHKRRAVGVSVAFRATYMGAVFEMYDHDKRCLRLSERFYDSNWMTVEDLAQWLAMRQQELL